MMLSDIRFAFRQILRHRGVSLIAVLTLALGIGANTAIFSVLHTVLIAPLPYPEADRLMMVFETVPDGGRNSVSGGAFKDWAEHGRHFEHLAVIEEVQLNWTGRGNPERLDALAASADLLPALGVEPMLGRGLLPGEDRPGGSSQVAVLTHELWTSRFGARNNVLGQTLELDKQPYTVVGVLPPNALFRDRAQVLIPTVVSDDLENWGRWGHWRQVVGRLHPDVGRAEAQADLERVKAMQASDYPAFKEDWGVAVVPLQEVLGSNTRPMLSVLVGTVLLVLLIACANISNLLLAQGTSRSREMAIRASLGAHRWRLVRQVLVECWTLAALGCGLGLVAAQWGIELLAARFATDLPRLLRPTLDTEVLGFSILLAGICGLLFGILPALRAGRQGLSHELAAAGRGNTSGSQRRPQTLLVVSELALTLMLLVGAGLFLRSFVILLDTDPGFDPRQTLAFDLSLPDTQYSSDDRRLAFLDQVETRLAALPGVEAVGTASSLPLSGTGRTEFVSRADQPPSTDTVVGCTFVGDETLQALGMTLLAGRTLRDGSTVESAPFEAVIDRDLARELFPDEDPLGHSLRFIGETWEIVGVVSPVRHFSLDRDFQPMVYLPLAHGPGDPSVVLRSETPPATLATAVRSILKEIDAAQPIANVRTLEASLQDSLAHRRAPLVLLGLFAALAVGLACLGVYGVMSFAVGQRARELGIRSALGANRREIRRLVLKGGLRPTLAGIGLGTLGALALAGLLESQLYAVAPHDPMVLVAAIALLATLAILAIDVPARRAANTSPLEVLRED